jgi:hypothetical protein
LTDMSEPKPNPRSDVREPAVSCVLATELDREEEFGRLNCVPGEYDVSANTDSSRKGGARAALTSTGSGPLSSWTFCLWFASQESRWRGFRLFDTVRCCGDGKGTKLLSRREISYLCHGLYLGRSLDKPASRNLKLAKCGDQPFR